MIFITTQSAVKAGFILVLSLVFCTACIQPQNEPAITIPEADLIPEGIAHDPATGTFYVSSTYKRKIVSVNSSGETENFIEPAQDGIWGVVGMRVDAERRLLWAASSHTGDGMPMTDMNPAERGSSGVFKYNLDTGKLIKKYLLSPDSGGHFLNDLDVNQQGDVFVTDSRTDAIYTISYQRDSLEMFIQLEKSPNGITLSDDERYLFVALRGDVGRVTVESMDFAWLAKPDDLNVGADGLYFYQNALIAVEPYDTLGAVHRYNLNDDLSAIDDHKIIIKDHPSHNQPTTGVVVENQFYYLANSQLQAFRRLYAEHGVDFPSGQLQNVVVLKAALD